MVDRIKKIIERENSNPSSFADLIGISRATMNHILNGRNNPSLDVVSKILVKHPDISTEWLMFGNLPMYKGDKAYLQPSLFDDIPVNKSNPPEKPEYRREMEVKSPENPIKIAEKEEIIPPKQIERTVDKIIIYYSDNTFENLIPEKR